MGDHYGRHEIEAQERIDALQPKPRTPFTGTGSTLPLASRRITDNKTVARNDYYVGPKNSTTPAERMSYADMMKFVESHNPDDYVFFELVPRKIEKKITIF